MVQQSDSDWLSINCADIYVAEEYFHHHAFNILNNNANFADNFSECLNAQIPVETIYRTKKKVECKGIEAKDLNKQIRELLKNTFKELKFEVIEDKGVFYFSSGKNAIGGFDFAFLDHHKNLINLRNLCFGELSYIDGEKRWKRFLKKNTELNMFAEQILDASKNGVDMEYQDSQNSKPLILGEIQFGNWALAYRDFFKVLKANVQNSIDCLIYVVPTNNLETMLSDGIVTFDNTVKIIKDFEKVISVPVWVIGLDIKFSESEPEHNQMNLFNIEPI